MTSLISGRLSYEIEGRVVWQRPAAAAGQPIRPGGAGIKFTDQSASAKLARELEDYEL